MTQITRTVGVAAAVATIAAAATLSPAAGADPLRDNVWNFRQSVNSPTGSSDALPLVDGFINLFFPGLIDEKTRAADNSSQFPNFHPEKCPPNARACLDLDAGVTWMQENGRVTYGPVAESAGAPNPETETPRGWHKVTRKVKDEISRPHNNAPMPFSVYFTNHGHAFHEGRVDLWSHGCVHLTHQDAKHYFNNLNIGDPVYIF